MKKRYFLVLILVLFCLAPMVELSADYDIGRDSSSIKEASEIDKEAPSPFSSNAKVKIESEDAEDAGTAEKEVVKKVSDEKKKDDGEAPLKREEGVSIDGFPLEGTVEAGLLRLREWPWGKVDGTYSKGSKVRVTGLCGEFYRVEVDGKEGYMHVNYITTPKKKASMEAPIYPGDTFNGGYLSKEEGKKEAINYAKRKDEAGSDPAALAGYKGGKLPPDKFLALFGPVARASMKKTGVPASVTLAQAALETGWGSATIGDAKNLFGIKGTGPAGKTTVATQECYGGKFVTINDGFRKYHTWQQSIDDHADLVSKGRYKSAWDNFQRTKNADEFARGIHRAGYATDPNYSSKLIGMMKSYNMYQWDK